MARGNTTEDLSTLQMALVGYEIEKQRIEEKIREIQASAERQDRFLVGGRRSLPASSAS